MPGGMGGGLEGILGSAVKGMSGMSGMGGQGGMGAFGAMGRQNQNNNSYANEQVSEYDIDRWKRADDIDSAVTTPTIQAVKDDWNADNKKARKEHFKKLRDEKPEKYLNKTREPSLDEIKEEKAMMERESSGTDYSAQMKKNVNRMTEPVKNENYVQTYGSDIDFKMPETVSCDDHVNKNYLGLESESAIEGFFTEDPLNSLYLAVDQLSFSPLSMSQTLQHTGAGKDLMSKKDIDEDSRKAYMENLKKSREERKYNVRIIE